MDVEADWKATNAAMAEKLRQALHTDPADRTPEQHAAIDYAAREHLDLRLAWMEKDDFPVENPQKVIIDAAAEAVRIWAQPDRRGFTGAMMDMQHAMAHFRQQTGRKPA